MIKYELTKAKKEDVENIFELYLKRINGMNEKNINQWNNNGYEVPAYYVHNFVTALSEKGVGRKILQAIEALAREEKKERVRQDCSDDNEFLNQYYESMGYQMAGTCKDGAYTGNRREKCFVLS